MSTAPSGEPRPEKAIIDSLRTLGLLADVDGANFEALTGGVSSDIWKVEAMGGLTA